VYQVGNNKKVTITLTFKTNKMLKSRSPIEKNTKPTQMTYTCGHILCNNTNSTNENQREE